MVEANEQICPLSDAKFLYNQLLLYYLKSSENDEKSKLLEVFIKTPERFKHMDIIKQLENDNLTKVEPIVSVEKKETQQ